MTLKQPTGDAFCEECEEYEKSYPECVQGCPCRNCGLMECETCPHAELDDDHIFYFNRKKPKEGG